MIGPWRAGIVPLLLLAVSCGGPKRVALPAGAGVPFPGFAAAYEQATAECRAVTSMTATLGLSGRSGSTKLRGRIDAGLSTPARVRLEGYPPVILGSKPFFVLVARGADATLVLPRDGRVLYGARPEEIVDALAGVPLNPADLRAVLSGCGLTGTTPVAARTYENGWAAIEQGDTTLYVRQQSGRWRVAAATRGSMIVQYRDTPAGPPQSVNIRTAPTSGAATDLTLKLNDVEWNTPLDDKVFDVTVPPGAAPLTLEELRRSGPLGGGN